MLSNTEFVRQSLELDLFFLRIMKEHAIFIEGGFTPKNSMLAVQADQFKNQFTYLLNETINLSYGVIRPETASSGEFVTPYTYNAERMTEYYTGIFIDSNVTMREMNLTNVQQSMNPEMLTMRVENLNCRIANLVQQLANFKENIFNDVLACRIFTHSYPTLFEHIRDEALHYLEMLTRLQNRMEIHTVQDAAGQEAFWNHIMAEHAKFIRGFLDPSEETLFKAANNFANIFDELTAVARAAQRNLSLLPQVTEDSLESTREIRDFKEQGTEGLLACQIKAVILPLLGDHVLREANHYLRLLQMYEMQV